MRNPKYRTDDDLTVDQAQARRMQRRALATLVEICDVARCPITEDAAFLKERLAKRVDAVMAVFAQAERLDPEVRDRLTISTTNVPT